MGNTLRAKPTLESQYLPVVMAFRFSLAEVDLVWVPHELNEVFYPVVHQYLDQVEEGVCPFSK